MPGRLSIGTVAGGVLLIIGNSSAYRRTASGAWSVHPHSIGPSAEWWRLVYRDGLAVVPCSSDGIAISQDGGITWTIRATPGSVFMVDIAAFTNRIWIFDNTLNHIHFSDDLGESWTDVGFTGAENAATLWSIACEPNNDNQIVACYEDGNTGDAMVAVCTDGATFVAKVAFAYNGVVAQINKAIWWFGSLVCFLQDVVEETIRSIMSNDDGDTWSAPVTIIDVTGPANAEITDVRVTENGDIFGGSCRDPLSAGNAGLFHSPEGSVYDLLPAHVPEAFDSLAFDEASGGLYVSYAPNKLFFVPNAEFVNPAEFVSSSIEITGLPEDLTFSGSGARMVVISE